MNKDRFNTKGCRSRQLRKKFIDVLAINKSKRPGLSIVKTLNRQIKKREYDYH